MTIDIDLDQLEATAKAANPDTWFAFAAARPEVVLALIERLRKAEAPTVVTDGMPNTTADGVHEVRGMAAKWLTTYHGSIDATAMILAFTAGFSAAEVRPRGPISDAQVLAALNATVKPEAAAPDLSFWGDTHTAVMRAALEAAEEVRS